VCSLVLVDIAVNMQARSNVAGRSCVASSIAEVMTLL